MTETAERLVKLETAIKEFLSPEYVLDKLAVIPWGGNGFIDECRGKIIVTFKVKEHDARP